MNSENLTAKAMNLADMVEYQEGAVVSKQIIKKDAGNITLFAFDKGEGLSEHTAPYDAAVLVVEGKAQIIISGVTHTVGAGELIIMPADKPHAVKAPEKFKMMLVMIKS